jgi:hypothetical protein
MTEEALRKSQSALAHVTRDDDRELTTSIAHESSTAHRHRDERKCLPG